MKILCGPGDITLYLSVFHMPLTLERQRRWTGVYEFEVNLLYMVRPFLKKNKAKRKRIFMGIHIYNPSSQKVEGS